MSNPEIIPRSQHSISRKSISPHALKVLYRLNRAGAEAYLVGGGVRDILLGKHPKDFDIVTDFKPNRIKALFHNCRLIGRRFRLAHIHFGAEIIEVATFRSHLTDSTAKHSEHGMILCDNVYGTLPEDIWRRDFTVNALYYNIADFSLVDFCKGLQDVEQKTLRLIGDPRVRYREDPVRLLRAIRFAAKLQFKIEPATEAPLFELGHLLEHVPPARLFDEFLKLFFKGHGFASFTLLQHYGLFHYLFPQTAICLEQSKFRFIKPLLEQALHNTDERLMNDKKVSPAFFLAVFLWYPLQKTVYELQQENYIDQTEVFMAAMSQVIGKQLQRMAIPRRITTGAQEIWLLQSRLENIHKKQALRLLHHPRFRAAYDFLLLRAQAGEDVEEQAIWWTKAQVLEEKENKHHENET